MENRFDRDIIRILKDVKRIRWCMNRYTTYIDLSNLIYLIRAFSTEVNKFIDLMDDYYREDL